MSITLRTVKSLNQGQTIWDTTVPGFGARRQLNAVSYVLKYRHNGKQRFIALGRHGVLTPDEARKKARKLLGLVASGADPVASKADSLGAVITEYLTHARKALRHSTFRNQQRYLQRDWRAYHSVPVTALKRRDVALGLVEIEAAHTPIIAARARVALSACIN